MKTAIRFVNSLLDARGKNVDKKEIDRAIEEVFKLQELALYFLDIKKEDLTRELYEMWQIEERVKAKTSQEMIDCFSAILKALRNHEGSNADALSEDCFDFEKCEKVRNHT